MGKVLPEADVPGAVQLSLLSQIVSEISLSTDFKITDPQRDCLIHSSNGLLQWMGLNALERQLETPQGLKISLSVVEGFPYPEQVRALGWMI